MVAEKSDPERLSVVGAPSFEDATNPVITTTGLHCDALRWGGCPSGPSWPPDSSSLTVTYAQSHVNATQVVPYAVA